MGAKEKRQQERIEAMTKRKKEVIEAAKEVFAEKSIEKTTMKDIAIKAEVGVASLYRYYSKKIDLVIEVAIDYWKNDFEYTNIGLIGNGIEQAAQAIDHLFEALCKQPKMLVFMEQFDNYIISHEVTELEEYNQVAIKDIPQFEYIIAKGMIDGSIREDIKSKEAIMTFIYLVMTLAQKMMIRSVLTRKNVSFDSERELEVYKEMVLKYLASA